MKTSFNKLALFSLVLLGSQAMAFELHCVRDERAVDGDSVKVDISFPTDGAVASVTIQEDGGGMTVEHHETTKLLDMSCKKEPGPFLGITCKGPANTLTVTDMELAPPPGGQFSHIYTVTTNYANKTFSFGTPGGTNSETTPNYCEWK